MPVLFSFLGSVLLVYMNTFSVFGLIGFYYPLTEYTNKLYVLMVMLILAVFNYFTLYKGKRYIDVFDDFDKEIDKYKSWNKSVPIYIISSILLMLVVLLIADYRHDGHL